MDLGDDCADCSCLFLGVRSEMARGGVKSSWKVYLAWIVHVECLGIDEVDEVGDVLQCLQLK